MSGLRPDVQRVIREYRCAYPDCQATVRTATDWFHMRAYAQLQPEWTWQSDEWKGRVTYDATMDSWRRYSARGELRGPFCPDHAPIVDAYEKALSEWWMRHRAAKKGWWQTVGRLLPAAARKWLYDEVDDPKPVPPWEKP